MSLNSIKKSKSGLTFDFLNSLLMILIVILMLYPFWYILINSFNDGSDAAMGGIYFLPRKFSLENYITVFKNPDIKNAYIVSIFRTILGTFIHVFFTAMVAYAMSKKDLIGRKFYMYFGVITMFFSGGLIPYYLLIRDLHLRDTFLVYIIPAMFSFWDMLIFMTFFRELPLEVEESAKIDGANDFKIFIRIIIPLSKPILATMALFNGVYHWNDFFTAVIFIDKQYLLPIQTILYKIVAESGAEAMLFQNSSASSLINKKVTQESVKLATMMATTVPIICVYPFMQKYFVKGILIGSVKG